MCAHVHAAFVKYEFTINPDVLTQSSRPFKKKNIYQIKLQDGYRIISFLPDVFSANC